MHEIRGTLYNFLFQNQVETPQYLAPILCGQLGNVNRWSVLVPLMLLKILLPCAKLQSAGRRWKDFVFTELQFREVLRVTSSMMEIFLVNGWKLVIVSILISQNLQNMKCFIVHLFFPCTSALSLHFAHFVEKPVIMHYFYDDC